MKKLLIVLLVVAASMMLVSGLAYAKVKGQCAECHTMHNSQNGVPMGVANNVGWSGGSLIGDDADYEAKGHLLIADCIGCHTNAADGATIIVAGSGGNTIPIVYNPIGLIESNMLAGGNFYYLDLADANGHNVINHADAVLPHGPGLPEHFAGLAPPGGHCAGSCHNTLYYPVRSGNTITGCQGCHYETFHHADPGAYTGSVILNSGGVPTGIVKADPSIDPTYRFLTGHHYNGRVSGGVVVTSPGVFVEGVEDANWEFGSYKITTTAAGDHNKYLSTAGSVPPGIVNSSNRSISAFCAACHEDFHVEQKGGYAGSQWVRHPVDALLPGTGEYAAYDYMTAYSTEAPVAFTTPSAPAAGTGAVMCVSCHRTHGSPNADMLRWDYSTQVAAGGGSGGCFTCHTKKDNP